MITISGLIFWPCLLALKPPSALPNATQSMGFDDCAGGCRLSHGRLSNSAGLPFSLMIGALYYPQARINVTTSPITWQVWHPILVAHTWTGRSIPLRRLKTWPRADTLCTSRICGLLNCRVWWTVCLVAAESASRRSGQASCLIEIFE